MFEKVKKCAASILALLMLGTCTGPALAAYAQESTGTEVSATYTGGSLFQYGKNSAKAGTNIKIKNDSGFEGEPGSANRVAYIQFENPSVGKAIENATLSLAFKNADSYPVTLKLYTVKDDSWLGQSLPWESGPALDPEGYTRVSQQALEQGDAHYIGDIVVDASLTDYKEFTLSITGEQLLFGESDDKFSLMICSDTKQTGNFYLGLGDKGTEAKLLIREAIMPTDITLSNLELLQNMQPGEKVGTFSTESQQADACFAYTLADGEGAQDNDMFRIDGETLYLNEGVALNSAEKPECSIRVRTTADNGTYFEKVFVLRVVEKSSAAELASLTIGGQVVPLVKGQYEYETVVTGNMETVSIVAVPASDRVASLMINDQSVQAGASVDMLLQEGDNSCTVKVVAEDGVTTVTYTVTVLKTEDLQMNSLRVWLNEEEQKAYTDFTGELVIDVDSDVHSIQLVPEVKSALKHTLEVEEIVDGASENPVISLTDGHYEKTPETAYPLLVGENRLKIILTGENGARLEYPVCIRRAERTQAETVQVNSVAELKQALVQAIPGDVIEIAEGVHTIDDTLLVQTYRDGAPEAPITIKGQGSGATLQRTVYRKGPVFAVYNDYYKIENITLDSDAYSTQGLLIHGASHGEVRNVTVKNTTDEAFKIKNSSQYWYFESCTAMDTGRDSKGPDNGHPGGLYAEGFYCGDANSNWTNGQVDRSGYITFNRCSAIRTKNDGWDCKEGSHDIKIINCLVDFQQTAVEQSMGNSGVFTRGQNVQIINTVAKNNTNSTTNGGELVHANGNRSYQGEQFGVGLEVFGCHAQNLYDSFYVMSFPEGVEADFKIYDNNTYEDIPVFCSPRSDTSAVENVPADTFVQLTWEGEGGQVYELSDRVEMVVDQTSFITDQEKATITGTLSAQASVEANGHTGTVTNRNGSFFFEVEVPLTETLNTFTVTARTASGGWDTADVQIVKASMSVQGKLPQAELSDAEKMEAVMAAETILSTFTEEQWKNLVPDQNGRKSINEKSPFSGGKWVWDRSNPDVLTDEKTGKVYPDDFTDQIEMKQVAVMSGRTVDVPVLKNGDSYQLTQALIDYRKQRSMMGDLTTLNKAYRATGDERYARRIALALDEWANAVPDYYITEKNSSELVQATDITKQFDRELQRAGYINGLGTEVAVDEINAFDSIYESAALQQLSAEKGYDVKEHITKDYFYNILDWIIEYQSMDVCTATNQVGYTIGIASLGNITGRIDYIDWMNQYMRILRENNFKRDYMYPSGFHYHKEFIDTNLASSEIVANYFVLYPPQTPEEQAVYDMTKYHIDFLQKGLEASGSVAFPNGDAAPFNDTHKGGYEPRNTTTSALLPAFGHVMLGDGSGINQTQFNLSFNDYSEHILPNVLGMTLYGFGDELIGGIRYSRYNARNFTRSTMAMNTVVVNQENQYQGSKQGETEERLFTNGEISLYEPGLSSVAATEVYSNYSYNTTSRYQRINILNTSDEEHPYLIDLFRVTGGETHDYILHGSTQFDETATSSLELEKINKEYPLLPEGQTWTEPTSMDDNRPDSNWYGMFRNMSTAQAQTAYTVTFEAEDKSGLGTKIFLLDDGTSQVYLGESPHSYRDERPESTPDEIYKYWRPSLVVRREAQPETELDSLFVSVIEPLNGESVIESIEKLPLQEEDVEHIALRITFKDGRQDTVLVNLNQKAITGKTDTAFSTEDGVYSLNGKIGVSSQENGVTKSVLISGDTMKDPANDIEVQQKTVTGTVSDAVRMLDGADVNALITDAVLPQGTALRGEWLRLNYGTYNLPTEVNGYTEQTGMGEMFEIDRVEVRDGKTYIITASDHALKVDSDSTQEQMRPKRTFQGQPTFELTFSATAMYQPETPSETVPPTNPEPEMPSETVPEKPGSENENETDNFGNGVLSATLTPQSVPTTAPLRTMKPNVSENDKETLVPQQTVVPEEQKDSVADVPQLSETPTATPSTQEMPDAEIGREQKAGQDMLILAAGLLIAVVIVAGTTAGVISRQKRK